MNTLDEALADVELPSEPFTVKIGREGDRPAL
jgi:hypothetical protein